MYIVGVKGEVGGKLGEITKEQIIKFLKSYKGRMKLFVFHFVKALSMHISSDRLTASASASTNQI